MKTKQGSEIIYPLTVNDLQEDAIKRIGRKLTNDELYTAKNA